MSLWSTPLWPIRLWDVSCGVSVETVNFKPVFNLLMGVWGNRGVGGRTVELGGFAPHWTDWSIMDSVLISSCFFLQINWIMMILWSIRWRRCRGRKKLIRMSSSSSSSPVGSGDLRLTIWLAALCRYRVKDKSDRATVEQVGFRKCSVDQESIISWGWWWWCSAGFRSKNSNDSFQDAESRNHLWDQRLHQHREGGMIHNTTESPEHTWVSPVTSSGVTPGYL